MIDRAAMNRAGAPRARRWRSWAGFVAGGVLLAGAAYVVWRDRAVLGEALRSARDAPLWNVAALFALPWISWTLTSLMYWRLMHKNGRARVRLGEMHMVLGAAWLMNYLPARPGMFGRLAYHKVVNGVPLAESVAASIAAVVCGIGATCILIGVSVATRVADAAGAWVFVALLLPVLVLCVVAMTTMGREQVRRASWALCARYLDVLSWLARYWVLFSMLGRQLTLGECAALTALSQAAAMVPLVGNGLGVREWASGLVGPALPAWMRAQDALTRAFVLSAELVHRGVELASCLPVGLVSVWYVARRLKQAPSPENSGGGSVVRP